MFFHLVLDGAYGLVNVYLLQGSVNFRLVILGEYTFITCENCTTRVLELMEPKNLPQKRSDLNLVNFLLQRACIRKCIVMRSETLIIVRPREGLSVVLSDPISQGAKYGSQADC